MRSLKKIDLTPNHKITKRKTQENLAQSFNQLDQAL